MKSKACLFITFAMARLLAGALSAQADITTGLVGYWPFTDGPGASNAIDGSGYINTGLLTNYADTTYNNMWIAITDPTNADSYALSFNPGGHAGSAGVGTNTYVNVANSPSLNLPSGNKAWTLSAWVYPTVAPASEPPNASIICKGTPVGGIAAYALYMSGGNFVTLIRNAPNSGGTTANTTNTLSANTWYNVTAVIQVPKPSTNSEILVYLNGVCDSPTNGNTYTTVWSTNAPVTIGSSMAANGLVTNSFVGYIDQVRIYDRALQANDVYQLYTNIASAEAPFITQQPITTTVDQGANFTNNILAISTSTAYYQWYTNNVAVTGATNSQFIINPATLFWNGVNYFAVVTNIYGATTSSVAQLTVLPTIPEIANQLPMTYTNLLGTNYFLLYSNTSPSFSVSTFTAHPVNYYWFTNGQPVGGINASNFTWTNVQPGSISDYCIISNSSGTATSMVWAATVLADPTNSSGGLAPYPQAVLALNPIAYWRMNDANVDGQDNNQGDDGYICHDYADGNDGIYTNAYYLGSDSPGYNPVADPSDSSATFSGNNSDVNSILAPDMGTPNGVNAEFTVEAWANPLTQMSSGTPTIVAKGGYYQEEFTLDAGAGTNSLRFEVRNAAGTAYNANSTVSMQNGANVNQWYHLVGVCDEANGLVSLYINGQLAASTAIPTASGITNSSTTPLTIGSRSSTDSQINNNEPWAGAINDVAIFNYPLSSNQIATEYGLAPVVVLPQSLTNNSQGILTTNIEQGANLSIPTAVEGVAPLSQQWYETNLTTQTGFLLAGQTGPTLLIPNAQTNDDYFLAASNSIGSTNSSVVAVIVSAGLNASLPTNVIEVYAGQPVTATFTAQASGSVPLYYQWNQNGSPLANATNASYTFTGAVTLGNTLFTCTVTNQYNGYSSTNTGPAMLVGIAPPLVFGTTNQYQVTVLGDKPIAYWRLDEGPDNGSGNDGTIAYDYAGGHNGTYTNVELGFAGIDTLESTDTAALFGTFNSSTTNSYVGEIINTGNGVSPINFGEPSGSNGEFSVECWVDVTNNLGGGIVTKGYGNGGEQFCLDTGNTASHDFRFFVRNAAGTAFDASSTLTLVAGSWYHVVGVCNESNSLVILYVDGVSNIATAITQNSGIINSTNDTADPAANFLSIGSRTSSSSVTNMNLGNGGFIQDVALYNYPLSAAQVLAHYQASGLYVAPVNTNPTNIVTAVTNNVLYLKWPADHTGWQLQAQTNPATVGISTNWVNYNPSTGTNQVVIPVNLTNGTVFYRLIYTP